VSRSKALAERFQIGPRSYATLADTEVSNKMPTHWIDRLTFGSQRWCHVHLTSVETARILWPTREIERLMLTACELPWRHWQDRATCDR
jgi:hypothetical protein